MKRSSARLFLIVLVAFAVAVLGVTIDSGGAQKLADQVLPGSSCVVGVTGRAASIAIEGDGASEWCDGIVTNSVSYYRYEGAAVPGGAVICQFHDGPRLYTIRDQGSLTTVGRQMCQELPGLLNITGS